MYIYFRTKGKDGSAGRGTQRLIEVRRNGCGTACESICVKPSALMGASSLLRAALFDYRSETEEGEDCRACKQDDLHANAEGRAASCALCVCVCVFVATQRHFTSC